MNLNNVFSKKYTFLLETYLITNQFSPGYWEINLAGGEGANPPPPKISG